MQKADNYVPYCNKLASTLGYLTVTCNLMSCLAMVLVLSMVRKIVKQSKFVNKGYKSPLKYNNVVILTHVAIILTYTVISILVFNVKATNGYDSITVNLRWDSVWTFVGAFADLFITCTLWTVTDKDQTPIAFR